MDAGRGHKDGTSPKTGNGCGRQWMRGPGGTTRCNPSRAMDAGGNGCGAQVGRRAATQVGQWMRGPGGTTRRNPSRAMDAGGNGCGAQVGRRAATQVGQWMRAAMDAGPRWDDAPQPKSGNGCGRQWMRGPGGTTRRNPSRAMDAGGNGCGAQVGRRAATQVGQWMRAWRNGCGAWVGGWIVAQWMQGVGRRMEQRPRWAMDFGVMDAAPARRDDAPQLKSGNGYGQEDGGAMRVQWSEMDGYGHVRARASAEGTAGWIAEWSRIHRLAAVVGIRRVASLRGGIAGTP
ncbi:hypothetical protein BJ912DRAFT_1067747 [Pholiota molesta]|nr:hypothetical protein BJ912DRAFT_1067747 [Pholiota molesta]